MWNLFGRQIRIAIYGIMIFIIFASTSAEASGNIYRLGGSNAPPKLEDIQLSNGQFAEMEFQIINYEMNPTSLQGGSQILFNVGWVRYFRLAIKNVGGRWVTFYRPSGSKNYVRDYFNRLNIKEDGLNSLKIVRKNDWISFYVNGKLVLATPVEERVSQVTVEVSNLEMEYRWIGGNFEFARSFELIIPGGQYHESGPLYSLNDGDIVRVLFNPMEINKDPKWANSIVFNIDSNTLWMDYSDGKYKFDYILDNGKDESDTTLHTLKKGMNYLDIRRQRNKVKLILNGQVLKVYKHIPLHKDAWPVKFKGVGMKIYYGAKKLRGITETHRGGKTYWSRRRTASPPKGRTSKTMTRMKIVDAGKAGTDKYSDDITKIDDGSIVKLYFKPMHLYRASAVSSDIAFDIDNSRIQIRNIQPPGNPQGLFLLDPYNTGNSVRPIQLSNEANLIEFRRKGDSAEVYLNGQFVRNFDNQSLSPWNLRIKVYGSRVGYWVEKK